MDHIHHHWETSRLLRDAALARMDRQCGSVHRSSRTSILVPMVPTAIFNSILGHAGSQRGRLRTEAILRRVSGKIRASLAQGHSPSLPRNRRRWHHPGASERGQFMCSCQVAQPRVVRTPSGERVAAHIDFQQCGAQRPSRVGFRRAGGAPLRLGRSRRLR